MTTSLSLDAAAASAFVRTITDGGIVLFPADTVYGLAVDPGSDSAVRRLYELKGRPATRPAAVMFFDLESALAVVEPATKTRQALTRLLPGPITVLLPNPRELFPLACGPDLDRLGLRVPALGGPLAPLIGVATPIVQSSANVTGAPDARRLAEIDAELRAGVDLELDAGTLPGTPSTVLDLSAFETTGRFTILREGAVAGASIESLLLSRGVTG